MSRGGLLMATLGAATLAVGAEIGHSVYRYQEVIDVVNSLDKLPNTREDAALLSLLKQHNIELTQADFLRYKDEFNSMGKSGQRRYLAQRHAHPPWYGLVLGTGLCLFFFIKYRETVWQ